VQPRGEEGLLPHYYYALNPLFYLEFGFILLYIDSSSVSNPLSSSPRHVTLVRICVNVLNLHIIDLARN
jgi:hypothetical protein